MKTDIKKLIAELDELEFLIRLRETESTFSGDIVRKYLINDFYQIQAEVAFLCVGKVWIDTRYFYYADEPGKILKFEQVFERCSDKLKADMIWHLDLLMDKKDL